MAFLPQAPRDGGSLAGAVRMEWNSMPRQEWGGGGDMARSPPIQRDPQAPP